MVGDCRKWQTVPACAGGSCGAQAVGNMVRHSDEFYDGMLQDAGGISCDFAYGLQDVIGVLDG